MRRFFTRDEGKNRATERGEARVYRSRDRSPDRSDHHPACLRLLGKQSKAGMGPAGRRLAAGPSPSLGSRNPHDRLVRSVQPGRCDERHDRDNLGMDAAGARALARRIEEQQAREERDVREESAAPTIPAHPPAPEQVSFAPAARKTRPPAASLGAESTHSVRPGTPKSPRRPDIRRYTTEVRRADKPEGPTVVTTIRCHSLVDGRWQSRVVDVRFESL
jgi:hypothetical protein